MLIAGWLLGALAILTAQEPTASEHVGPIFDLHIPADYVIEESGNGQFFFLEVRRRNAPEDLQYPLLKLLAFPGTRVKRHALRDSLISDFKKTLPAGGYTVQTSSEVRRKIEGVERVGIKLIVHSASPFAEFEFYGYETDAGSHAVISKVLYGEERAMSAAVATALDSLSSKILTAEATRAEPLGPFVFAVPALAPESKQSGLEITKLTLGLVGGQFDLHSEELDLFTEAGLTARRFLDQRAKEIRTTIAGVGGKISARSWCGRWIRGGLLCGERLTIQLPDGETLAVCNYTLAAGQFLLAISVELRGPQAETVEEQVAKILGTLAMPGQESLLDAGLGRLRLHAAGGLAWSFPDRLQLVGAAPGRVVLGPTRDAYGADTRFGFEARNTAVSESELAASLAALVQEAYPGATLGKSWEIEGKLLGQTGLGRARSFAVAGIRHEIHGMLVKRGQGALFAWLITAASDSAANLWSFANLAHRLTEIPSTTRKLLLADLEQNYETLSWEFDLVSFAHGEDLIFQGARGVYVKIHTERWSDLQPTRPLADLQRRAQQSRMHALRHANEVLAQPAEDYETLITKESEAQVELGGTRAWRHRMQLLSPAGQRWTLDSLTLVGKGSVITVEARVPAGDAAARAAVAALLAGLSLNEPLEYGGD